MTIARGTRLGPYEVLALRGSGGMGEVYRARDTRLDRIVAVKVLSLRSDSPDRRARFQREARAISSLSHPHICALYDVGQQDGIDFLVMEYLEGDKRQRPNICTNASVRRAGECRRGSAGREQPRWSTPGR